MPLCLKSSSSQEKLSSSFWMRWEYLFVLWPKHSSSEEICQYSMNSLKSFYKNLNKIKHFKFCFRGFAEKYVKRLAMELSIGGAPARWLCSVAHWSYRITYSSPYFETCAWCFKICCIFKLHRTHTVQTLLSHLCDKVPIDLYLEAPLQIHRPSRVWNREPLVQWQTR